MTSVKGLRVYTDASGAPATVQSGEFVFAVDTIAGETRLHSIGGPSSHRRGHKKAVALATHAYTSELRKQLADRYEAWMATNVALYAVEEYDLDRDRACTSVTSRWCPVHGDCQCPANTAYCPLHSSGSPHRTL
jgi:hypothetical protein